MNLKGNAAPEVRGAKPFQHSNIYYDTFFSQNAAVAIFQKGLSQKCGKCGIFFIKCGQNFENVGNVGPLGTLYEGISAVSQSFSEFKEDLADFLEGTQIIVLVRSIIYNPRPRPT